MVVLVDIALSASLSLSMRTVCFTAWLEPWAFFDSVRNGGWAAWCHHAMFVLDPGHVALAAKSTPVACLSVCLSLQKTFFDSMCGVG